MINTTHYHYHLKSYLTIFIRRVTLNTQSDTHWLTAGNSYTTPILFQWEDPSLTPYLCFFLFHKRTTQRFCVWCKQYSASKENSSATTPHTTFYLFLHQCCNAASSALSFELPEKQKELLVYWNSMTTPTIQIWQKVSPLIAGQLGNNIVCTCDLQRLFAAVLNRCKLKM